MISFLGFYSTQRRQKDRISAIFWLPVYDRRMHTFTPEEAAARFGTSKLDKPLRLWLAGLPIEERISFLKQLWPINYRYALELAQGAQLSRQESEALLRHWLKAGQHSAVKDLIRYLKPVLGARRFRRVVSEESLSDAMRHFLDYHEHN